MEKMKVDIKKIQQQEALSLQDVLETEQKKKEVNFIKNKDKEDKERQKNKLLEELELMRKIRAQEVLQELKRKGIKKISNQKVSEIEKKEEVDYDMIMQFYQNLQKKEKEQVEAMKKQKLKDVEYWAKALKEEEKVTVEKYCEEHGEQEMKQIQKAIQDRHKKELQIKINLEKANPLYLQFKELVMRERRVEHKTNVEDFINEQGEELKKSILKDA